LTPHDLITAFDAVAGAPNGVKRLRTLILELAVRGRLIPQNPADEPASALLGRIRSERARQNKRGKDSSRRVPPTIPAEAPTPFVVPVGWTAIRLLDLGDFVSGKTPSKSKASYWTGGIPWVSPKDMKFDDIISTQDEVSGLALEDGLALVPAGSVLIVVRSGILRHTVPVAINAIPCTINQDLKALVLSPSVLATYVRLMVRGFESYILEHLTKVGTTVESMKFIEFSEQLFIFPPIAEQQRIIARVDELIGLLDRLAVARSSGDTTRVFARNSTLASIRQADTPDELGVAWRRFAQRIDDLLVDPTDIAPLRQTILQLAVRGRLVPQDPSDGNASELLESLRSSRRELLESETENPEAATILRKVARLAPARLTKRLPSGWSFAHLLDVVERIVDCHNKTAPYVAHGIPIVRTTNVRDGRIAVDGMKFISEQTYSYWSHRCPPIPGDIIFTREAPMGQAAIIPPGMRVCLGQRTMLVRPMKKHVLGKFLLLSLLEPGVIESARQTAVGMTVKHLRVGDVETLPMAIPPLAEQHRIVDRVDELMALLDRLEAELVAAQATQTAFAAAAVHHIGA
jgi:type I restriction enzyme, S subunit